MAGLVWFGMPHSYANLLRYSPHSHGAGFGYLVLYAACNWLGDTGALVFGSLLGRHKVAPAVSPNKTWEGVFGGMSVSVLTSYGVCCIKDSPGLHADWFGSMFPMIACHHYITIGCLVAVLGTAGDFGESALKRAAQVKDTGTFMPGHGGFLDRNDGLMLCVPAIFLYVATIVTSDPAVAVLAAAEL
jgi:phosphatidate cytidylyltransferase